jgi:hypothetical protein
MTATQKLKYLILIERIELDARDNFDTPFPTPDYPCYNIDELYKLSEEEDPHGTHQDALGEIRGGTYKTAIDTSPTRDYEADAVAAILPDGTAIGWTYFHGGGRHGRPGDMPWVEHAYDLKYKPEVIEIITFYRP